MFQSEISKEAVADLKLIQYEGPIIVIDSTESLKEEIDQIKFGSRVLRAAQELTALPVVDQVVPDI